MNITDQSSKVLSEIDARKAAIAGNWPDERRALDCLKTAIEEWVRLAETGPFNGLAFEPLTTIINQWNENK